MLREVLTRYGRHNIGVLWLFVEPMLFTLGVTALWTATKATHGSTIPIAAFALTGYSTVLLWRNCAGRCGKAIEPNLSLLYHRNVRVFDIFASRITLEIAGATLSLIFLTAVFIATIDIPPPADLSTMLTAWTLMAWFAAALGLTVGALSEMSETFDRLWHTATYLLFPLSGAVFMVDWLPSAARETVLLIPMVHGTEMLRDGYFAGTYRTHYSAPYLMSFNLALTWVGLSLTRKVSSEVELQ